VRTDTQDNNEFLIESTVNVGFLVTKNIHRDGIFSGNFCRGTASDKDGLSTPFDSNGLAHGNVTQIEFGKGQGQDIGRRTHAGHKLDHQKTCRRRVRKSDGRKHQVGKGTTFGFGDLVDAVIFVSVIDATEVV
jgi:hypothetical protein